MSKSPHTQPIQNVSDTARWVAAYRAIESERPDALFKDPDARLLAGAEGERIIRALWGGDRIAWALAVRTQVIDEMILRAIRDEGVDLVLNLACGLDTRPYRLELPEDLQWVEADFPDMIIYKEEKLRERIPRCRLMRVHADLSEAAARQSVISRAAQGGHKILVLTEGLLCYLNEAQVVELAGDLGREERIAFWVTDLFSSGLVAAVRRTWGRQLERGGAPILFGPRGGSSFFASLGWRSRQEVSVFEEGKRLGRELRGARWWRPVFGFAPAFIQGFVQKMYVIVQLERQ